MFLAAGWFAHRSAAAVEILASAIPGEPYGIATIEVPLDPPVLGELPPLQVTEVSGRILYPIAEDVRADIRPPGDEEQLPPRGPLIERLRTVIRDLSAEDKPTQQTVARRVSFLFVGDQPLRVEVGTTQDRLGLYEIVPESNPNNRAEMVASWWKGYTEAAQRQINSADYPPWVENYLLAMLSGRTGQPLPAWFTDLPPIEDDLLSAVKLIGGAEGIAEPIFRRSAIGNWSEPTPATLPLPAPPQWAPLYDAQNLGGIPVEPMATRVSPNWFYVRYGSFENFLWFKDLSAENGGEISRMVTVRGWKNDSTARVERQLSMETSQLSRLLGPTVIEDQALVGRDLFLGDGASMGVMFHAKNAFLLRTSLNNDRSKAAAEADDVTLTQLKIDGHPVTFLSSVDNRVRSYMVADGDFVLVANNESMIREFIEVGRTGESLAETAAFRLARQLMPLERNDVIFAYFSPQMLRGLVSPTYLIELRRRMQAKADIALVHLARLAAAQELNGTGGSGESTTSYGIDQLMELGFLPTRFGTRPDGSGVVTVGSDVIDTRRGARGTFLPIADVTIDAVTAEEAEWYGAIAQQYTTSFPTIDPIMVGIGREQVSEKPLVERITLHAEVAPWDPGKYGSLADQLGPPTRAAVRFAPDDIIAAQAHVASPTIGPPTHLFAAIKDSTPPGMDKFKGILNLYLSLRSVPGYLGAWPQPGALDRLPLGLGIGQPVGPGTTRLLGGVYRYTDGEFSVLSFQPEVLQATLPQLAVVDAQDMAQVRLHAGDLRGSQIEGWVNAQLYQRAREGSVAGVNFLGLLSRQLDVEPSEAMDQAEQIFGAGLQCPLGGQYLYSESTGRWVSDAWGGPVASEIPPRGYQAPMMSWFRGASASLTQYQDRLVADAVINIQRQ